MCTVAVVVFVALVVEIVHQDTDIQVHIHSNQTTVLFVLLCLEVLFNSASTITVLLLYVSSHNINVTGGKFTADVIWYCGNLPPVSFKPTGIVDTGGEPWLAKISAIKKNQNDPNVIFRGVGEDD
jgi:hypothetical protein